MSRVVKLEELCIPDQIGKYGIPAVAEEFSEDKVRYLRITDIDDYGNLLENDKKSVSSPEIEKYILKEGDIVFARTGNSTGRTYFHEEKNGELAFAGFLIKFSLDESKVNPKYLKYFTISKPYKQWVDNLSNGSTRGNINAKTFAECPIILPPRAQQDYLVRVLSSLEEKIQINDQINQELEAMAKTLYDYWFVQFDFPDQNGKPYKSSGGKMVYNPELKREIPEEWGVDSLWNIANFYNGLAMQKYRPDTNGDDYLPVIKIREMMNGFSKDTEKARLDIPTEAVVERGDILFSWSATLEVIIWGKERGALNQHIFKVTSDTYPKSFIYFELKSYLKVFKSIAELRKTTMGHITQDHLKQAKIVVPPIEIISKLDAKLQPIMLKQQILENQNQELTQLRDWLLPMLMNGQVKVE